MKNRNWLICLLFFSLTINAQITPGNTCADATCSIQGSYSSQTGSPTMGSFGCLYSTPNANWIAIHTTTDGSVHYVLTQTNSYGNGIDVDFAVYGPYNSVTDACPITGSTPTVDCSYSASSTEYIDIPNAQAGDVYIILITNYNGSAGSITLSPNPNNPSTADMDCNIDFGGVISSTPALCGQATGSVEVEPTGGHPPYTYSWDIPGNPNTPVVNNVPPGTYSVTITSSPDPVTGSSYNPATLTITVEDQESTATGSATLVSCLGGNDGTATASSTAPGTLTYQWNDPNNQTTQTAVGLTAGLYECVITSSTGCVNTVEVVVDEIPAMQLTVTSQTDVTCHDGNDGTATISVSQGTAPYNYSWSNSASTTGTANDLRVGEHTLTVTDANGCLDTKNVLISEPDPLEIISMSTDTIICIDDEVELFAIGAGGSSAYTYTWKKEDEVVAVGSQVVLTPTSPVTTYCVTLSEACGSPVAEECVTVSYPQEVKVMLSPDKTAECFPIEVTFENTTETEEVIDYTTWIYSDGDRDTTQGTLPVTHEFGEGLHDVKMIVTTERGCVYDRDYPNLIQGYPMPKADFYATPNPASMYDPVVNAFSQSSNDIDTYTWHAPGAKPSFSSSQNPTFLYPEEVKDYELKLIVESEFGCLDSIQKLVRIENDVLIFAPNTFTPDGDEFNENWKVHIEGIDIHNFHLQLYNRWGEIVYESFDPEGEWDGTYGSIIAPAGVYIWKINASDFENDNKYEFNGFVTIIR